MKSRVLIITFLVFVSIPLIYAQEQFVCSFEKDVPLSENYFVNDPTVVEFLKLYPESKYTTDNAWEEPLPPQTYAQYLFKDLHLVFQILEYNPENTQECYFINGYKLFNQYTPNLNELNFQKDPNVIIELLDTIKPRLRGGPQNIDAIQSEEKYQFVDFSYAHIIGEPIKFILEKTRDSNCNSYNAKITDDDGNFIWGGGADISCDPTSISSSVLYQTKIGYNEDHPIIINESGKYYLEVEFRDVFIKREFAVRQNHGGLNIDDTDYSNSREFLSPLKQIKSGIATDKIRCNDGLKFILKYDSSPACVKPETKMKLIERGWTIEDEKKPETTVIFSFCGADGFDSKGNLNSDNSTHHWNSNECEWYRIVNSDDSGSDKESSTVFHPRYHLSIFENTKTTQQYVAPDFITIGPGSQVTWSNYDNIPVAINFDDPDDPWSTGIILSDGYATITFDETGIYEFHGNPRIHGIIVVMDDDGELLSSTFDTVFDIHSPLIYKKTLEPVLLYDNCERYAYWLTEHQKNDINQYDETEQYPSGGDQIFPLVDYCITNGDLVKTISGDHYRWEFQLENEN